MKSVLRFLYVAVIGALFSASASAVPVLWSVNGLSRADGGTISGSFIYDADANGGLGAYSAINVTTTQGTEPSVPGETYAGFDPGLTDEFGPTLQRIDGGTDSTGQNQLELQFLSPLTNAGGTLALNSGQERACNSPDCGFINPPPVAVSGTIVGTPLSTPPPTPTPTATPVPALPLPLLGLLVAIVLGFGLRRLRRG